MDRENVTYLQVLRKRFGMTDIWEGHEHRGKPQKEGKPRIIIIVICKDDMRGECGTYGENYLWDFGGET